MSRNLILTIGAVLWSAFAVDALGHSVSGDWMFPAVAIVVGVTWLVLRRNRLRRPQTA
jgi:hypothetical protein